MNSMPNMMLHYLCAGARVRPMAKRLGTCVVTAQRTDDGAPVYLNGAGEWVADVGRSAAYPSEQAAESALVAAQGQQRVICDPYLMAVTLVDGQPHPTSARERIRSEGPTSRLRRPDPEPLP